MPLPMQLPRFIHKTITSCCTHLSSPALSPTTYRRATSRRFVSRLGHFQHKCAFASVALRFSSPVSCQYCSYYRITISEIQNKCKCVCLGSEWTAWWNPQASAVVTTHGFGLVSSDNVLLRMGRRLTFVWPHRTTTTFRTSVCVCVRMLMCINLQSLIIHSRIRADFFAHPHTTCQPSTTSSPPGRTRFCWTPAVCRHQLRCWRTAPRSSPSTSTTTMTRR